LIGGFSQSAAAAGIAMPKPGIAAQMSQDLQPVHWKCGPFACYWTPGYRGPIPRYARAWDAPRRPGCFWRRNYYGRWVMICR
jgi:hypothetical protein